MNPCQQKLVDKGILIVDDDELICSILKNILSFYFSRVYIAGNGVEGLLSIEKYEVDLVISDITMPVMDGLEMAECIANLPFDLPLIFMTGHNDDEMCEAMFMFTTFIMIKPISGKELLSVISQAIGVSINNS